MSDDISCKELVDFVMRYLDGELPEGQRAVFDQHLKDCPPCEHYLDSYKPTVALEKDCAKTPPKLPESLVRGIVEAMKKQS